MSLKRTKEWFEQAIPEPTIEQACIQIGCHLEEVSGMANAIGDFDLSKLVLTPLSNFSSLVSIISLGD